MNKIPKFIHWSILMCVLLPSSSFCYVYGDYYWLQAEASYDYHNNIPYEWQMPIDNAAGAWDTWTSYFDFYLSYGSDNIIMLDQIATQFVGLTTVWHSGDYVVCCTTRLNSDKEWSTSGEPDKYDVWNVMAHEFGHWLVLDNVTKQEDMHTTEDYTTATMYKYLTVGETLKRDLIYDDIMGIVYIYEELIGVEEYYIQVNSPNGGEVWYFDETHDIT